MLLLTNFLAQSACTVGGPKRSPAIVSKPSLRPTYFAFSYLFFSFSMQQNYCNTFSFAKHFFSFGSQITKRQTEECLWYIHFITRLGCHSTYFNNKQVKITIYTIESDRDAWKHFDFSEIFVDLDLLGQEHLDHFSRL